eukprot:scaffold36273_cov150-Isochrysis_galbana.AAC.4
MVESACCSRGARRAGARRVHGRGARVQRTRPGEAYWGRPIRGAECDGAAGFQVDLRVALCGILALLQGTGAFRACCGWALMRGLPAGELRMKPRILQAHAPGLGTRPSRRSSGAQLAQGRGMTRHAPRGCIRQPVSLEALPGMAGAEG